MKGLTLFALVVLSVTFAVTFAATPAQNAETVRSSLTQVQLELNDPAEARALLGEARAAYRDLELKAPAPELATAASTSLKDAERAVASGDAVALAHARGTLWTVLLHVGYRKVDDALERGEVTAAKRWLGVREFRHATRLLRPNADATLVLGGLREGTTSPQDAHAAVKADLLDTCQARLNEALSDVSAAEAAGFAGRRAEEAALARGYFRHPGG